MKFTFTALFDRVEYSLTAPQPTEPEPVVPLVPAANATEELPKMHDDELPLNSTAEAPSGVQLSEGPSSKVSFQESIPRTPQPAPTHSALNNPDATALPPSSSPPRDVNAPVADVSHPNMNATSGYENVTTTEPTPVDKTSGAAVMVTGEEPGHVTTDFHPVNEAGGEPVTNDIQHDNAHGERVANNDQASKARGEDAANEMPPSNDTQVEPATNELQLDEARAKPANNEANAVQFQTANDTSVEAVAKESQSGDTRAAGGKMQVEPVEPASNTFQRSNSTTDESSAEPNVASAVDDVTEGSQKVTDAKEAKSKTSATQAPTPKPVTRPSIKTRFLGVPSTNPRVHDGDKTGTQEAETPTVASASPSAGPTPSSRDQEDLDDLEDHDAAASDAITIIPTSSATTSSSPFAGADDSANVASPSPRRGDQPTVSTVGSTSSAPGTVSTSSPTTPAASSCKNAVVSPCPTFTL